MARDILTIARAHAHFLSHRSAQTTPAPDEIAAAIVTAFRRHGGSACSTWQGPVALRMVIGARGINEASDELLVNGDRRLVCLSQN
jgi:hypothetical protein